MKTNSYYIIPLFALLLLVTAEQNFYSQSLNQKLDSALNEFVKLDQFSGTVLIAKDGEVLYGKGFGEADKDFHVKNNLDTKFNIGSIGKTFTGISIMQLEERGKLSVTDPVIDYLPDFPFGEKITIEHLLTHTSGTFNYFAHPDFQKEMINIRSINEALKLIYDQDLLFNTPGERFSYSNSGIVILGAVIEKLTGMEYKKYIEENILKPAGMKDTGINYLDEVVENRAVGYIKSPTGNYRKNIFIVPPANADGGIETTANDMLRYDQALYSDILISENSKEKMFTPFLDNYGYTMIIENRYDNKVVGHSGGAPGVNAYFSRYLNDKILIVVLSNYSNGARNIIQTVEAIVFGQNYETPRPTVDELLYSEMINNGIENTLKNISTILQGNGYTISSSNILNNLGYALLGENNIKMAIAVFELNIKFFPDESNPYDSLGDAYLQNGEIEKAKKAFEKAIELDPSADYTRSKLNELLEEKN